MSFVGSHYLAKMAQEDPKDEDNEDAETRRFDTRTLIALSAQRCDLCRATP